ncbi:MAG: PEP-utilizing enzyme [Patescibacteria group bacterium]|nr:PEP-utilizing enzyme [Patescibacteria group bacterium]
MAIKSKVTLLGIWNILIEDTWAWFCDEMVEHFLKLTGRRIGVFTYHKDELYYGCFISRTLKPLREDLEKISALEQQKYVRVIVDDYYRQAKILESFLIKLAKINFKKESDQRLANNLKKLFFIWPKVTMQIWYAVLIDIWYPSPADKLNLKQIIAPARDHCGRLHEKSNLIEKNIYTEIARRFKIDVKQIYYLIPPEIIRLIRTRDPKILKTVELRMKICVATNASGEYTVYDGAEAEGLVKQFNPPTAGERKEQVLKGLVACPGKVRGRVRVILRNGDFMKFKKGEVLVALQTMVHYIPIMKLSSAILTEFGGLTSHAAIVGRELKKPCIVGIPNLIASLKDGDLVEVDADKGVVKILKRK